MTRVVDFVKRAAPASIEEFFLELLEIYTQIESNF